MKLFGIMKGQLTTGAEKDCAPKLGVTVGSASVKYYPASAAKSCDQCRYQEGRHYCLFHSVTLKNMDTIRCHSFAYLQNIRNLPRDE
jgi:hypothetical protein